jgi:hypothetical protein
MLIPISLPSKYLWLIFILEREQKVLSVSKKSILRFPGLCAKPSKFPAKLILAYQYGVFILSALLKKSDQTAAIDIQ